MIPIKDNYRNVITSAFFRNKFINLDYIVFQFSCIVPCAKNKTKQKIS